MGPPEALPGAPGPGGFGPPEGQGLRGSPPSIRGRWGAGGEAPGGGERDTKGQARRVFGKN